MKTVSALLLQLCAIGAVTASSGKCPDKSMGNPAAGQKLTDLCVKCITDAKAEGCASPKFCPGITGEPWCGAAKTTGCDSGVGTEPGSVSVECCQQYVNKTVAVKCGGKPECPDKQLSEKEYDQLSGAEVTQLCEQCFDLGKKTGCETTHFCPEETGYPWCGDKQLGCDALGPDKLTGVTAAMGRGCCQKYAQDNTSNVCGGMPCPDDQAADASKASCHACFASGRKQNCKTIGFCTVTKFGQLPWCGPDEPNYCTGKQVYLESGCDSLPDVA